MLKVKRLYYREWGRLRQCGVPARKIRHCENNEEEKSSFVREKESRLFCIQYSELRAGAACSAVRKPEKLVDLSEDAVKLHSFGLFDRS